MTVVTEAEIMTAGATGLGIVTTGEVATDATDREVAAAAGAGIAEVARRPAPLGRVAGPAEIGVECLAQNLIRNLLG